MAADYYERALTLDPSDIYTPVPGKPVLFKGSVRAGPAAFSQGWFPFPEVACAHWCIGDAWYALGKFAEAETAYKKAVEVEPACKAAHRHLKQFSI